MQNMVESSTAHHVLNCGNSLNDGSSKVVRHLKDRTMMDAYESPVIAQNFCFQSWIKKN